jgi:hypothetical protein
VLNGMQTTRCIAASIPCVGQLGHDEPLFGVQEFSRDIELTCVTRRLHNDVMEISLRDSIRQSPNVSAGHHGGSAWSRKGPIISFARSVF